MQEIISIIKRHTDKEGNVYLSGTQITALPDNLTVGGGLYLSGTQITALPDNLTVGGGLYLSGTQITALPDNLTVGGWLDLSGTQITALPDNLTVGGRLDLSGTQITDKEKKKVKRLIDGTIKKHYIYADGVLFQRTGRKHKIGEYTVYSGKIKDQMLVTDGELWAHCKTAKEGIADILFKRAKDRGADQYKGIDIDTPRTVEELKTIYRIITGACRAGTEEFVNSLHDLKETYTIREAIEITKGQYNADRFAKFFQGGMNRERMRRDGACRADDQGDSEDARRGSGSIRGTSRRTRQGAGGTNRKGAER